MKGICESTLGFKHSSKSCTESPNRLAGSVCSEAGPSGSKSPKSSVWSGFLGSAFSIFDNYGESQGCIKKTFSSKNHGWSAAVKKMMYGGSMRMILGFNRTGVSGSKSDIWLLGNCYAVAQEDPSADPTQSEGFAAFVEDFSSRILITYRKGFDPIGDSKYTSDVNWGCMLRSSQMLVAQALICHRLGRTWRRPLLKTADKTYIEILKLFGDSEESAYSIHNLLLAGKSYGLAPGSWVGPYAMCRTWETLFRFKREETQNGSLSWPMAIYVVSGDEDGERGGAPVLCIEDISRHCLEFSTGQVDWTPVLLLVPLVLGLDKINPRYLPLLEATFTFPQSLGILGGRPGASTYIIGVQDDKAFYLDPHEVQQVVDVKEDNLEVDTSSYHCNVVRNIPLDSIDPSLAIGFYCREKSDFNDFILRASELADQANGAPLFTVTETRNYTDSVNPHSLNAAGVEEYDPLDVTPTGESETGTQEDDWQLL